MSSKTFQNTVKAFRSNKDFSTESTITIEQEMGNLETDQVTLLNNYYINIVTSSPGTIPTEIRDSSSASMERKTVKQIFETYKNHSNGLKINKQFQSIK